MAKQKAIELASTEIDGQDGNSILYKDEYGETSSEPQIDLT